MKGSLTFSLMSCFGFQSVSVVSRSLLLVKCIYNFITYLRFLDYSLSLRRVYHLFKTHIDDIAKLELHEHGLNPQKHETIGFDKKIFYR